MKFTIFTYMALALLTMAVVVSSVSMVSAGVPPTNPSIGADLLNVKLAPACRIPTTTPAVGTRQCSISGGSECACGYYASGWICGACANGCDSNTGRCTRTTSSDLMVCGQPTPMQSISLG